MLVDDSAVLVEEFYGNTSFGSRSRNIKTSLHVLDDLQRRTTERDCFDVRGRTRGDRLGLGNGCGSLRRRAWFASCATSIAVGFHHGDLGSGFSAVAGRL